MQDMLEQEAELLMGQQLLLVERALPDDPDAMAALKLLGVAFGDPVPGLRGIAKFSLPAGWTVEPEGVGIKLMQGEHCRATIGCMVRSDMSIHSVVRVTYRYEIHFGMLTEGFGLAVGYVFDNREHDVPFYTIQRGLSDDAALMLVRENLEEHLNTECPGWDDPARGYAWD